MLPSVGMRVATSRDGSMTVAMAGVLSLPFWFTPWMSISTRAQRSFVFPHHLAADEGGIPLDVEQPRFHPQPLDHRVIAHPVGNHVPTQAARCGR